VISDILDTHSVFIGELGLICEKRRKHFLYEYEGNQLDSALAKETFELENMEKDKICESFLQKKYLLNIFDSTVEEGLYTIETERANIMRNRQKIDQTGGSLDTVWKDSNLFTSEGSAYALALFLYNKLMFPDKKFPLEKED